MSAASNACHRAPAAGPSLLDALLAEQQSLSAVETFARAHEAR